MAWPTSGDYHVRPPSPTYEERRPGRHGESRIDEEPSYGNYDDSVRDWEQRERFRQWEEYERARADWERRVDEYKHSNDLSYDHHKDRLKRPRSPSPYGRYARPRYDSYDGYIRRDRYDLSPLRHDYSPEYRRQRNAMLFDPMTQDKAVTFRVFSDWYRDMYPERFRQEELAQHDEGNGKKVGMEARYEEYRTAYSARQVRLLFEKHRKAAWFLEKYDPTEKYLDLRARVRKHGWDGALDRFLHELEEGKHDPVPDQSAVSSEPIPQQKEISDAKEDVKMKIDEDDEKIDDDFESGEGGTKAILDNDEIIIPQKGHQVMIRTIPPEIGRLDLEPIVENLDGVMSLALGEPVSRRQYLRSAWIEFETDSQARQAMEQLAGREIENFRLHVSMINTPLIAKIKRASVLLSQPERLGKDLKTIKMLVHSLEKQADMLAKYVPLSLKPNEQNDNQPEKQADVEGSTLKDMSNSLDPHRGTAAIEAKLKKMFTSTEEDEMVEKRIEAAVDLYLAYLRSAFHCCYYCSVVADRADELQRKCVKHVRAQFNPQEYAELNRNSRRRERDHHWLLVHDEKMEMLVQKDNVDPIRFGGKSLDEELPYLLRSCYGKEEENKFRCFNCNKMFKSESYVSKHIYNKHPELATDDLLYEFRLYNNFALDPHRIQAPPSQPPPAMNGHNARSHGRDGQRNRKSPPHEHERGGSNSRRDSIRRNSPPPNTQADPRENQRVSYQDLDEVVGEDVALMY